MARDKTQPQSATPDAQDSHTQFQTRYNNTIVHISQIPWTKLEQNFFQINSQVKNMYESLKKQEKEPNSEKYGAIYKKQGEDLLGMIQVLNILGQIFDNQAVLPHHIQEILILCQMADFDIQNEKFTLSEFVGPFQKNQAQI